MHGLTQSHSTYLSKALSLWYYRLHSQLLEHKDLIMQAGSCTWPHNTYWIEFGFQDSIVWQLLLVAGCREDGGPGYVLQAALGALHLVFPIGTLNLNWTRDLYG
jgi:hypothetical protein